MLISFAAFGFNELARLSFRSRKFLLSAHLTWSYVQIVPVERSLVGSWTNFRGPSLRKTRNWGKSWRNVESTSKPPRPRPWQDCRSPRTSEQKERSKQHVPHHCPAVSQLLDDGWDWPPIPRQPLHSYASVSPELSTPISGLGRCSPLLIGHLRET